MKKPSRFILVVQAILTVLGAVSSLIMFKRSLGNNVDILTLLSSIIYILVYVLLIVYASINYKKENEIYYKTCIYGYAALLGVEILTSGKFMQGLGLSDNLTLLVNTFNLISFACVIKFGEILSQKRAINYIGISNLLKLAVELYLIIIMFKYIGVIEIITALSVPVLGFVLMVAYMHKYGE